MLTTNDNSLLAGVTALQNDDNLYKKKIDLILYCLFQCGGMDKLERRKILHVVFQNLQKIIVNPSKFSSFLYSSIQFNLLSFDTYFTSLDELDHYG
jgi:hypothetical protein